MKRTVYPSDYFVWLTLTFPSVANLLRRMWLPQWRRLIDVKTKLIYTQKPLIVINSSYYKLGTETDLSTIKASTGAFPWTVERGRYPILHLPRVYHKRLLKKRFTYVKIILWPNRCRIPKVHLLTIIFILIHFYVIYFLPSVSPSSSK